MSYRSPDNEQRLLLEVRKAVNAEFNEVVKPYVTKRQRKSLGERLEDLPEGAQMLLAIFATLTVTVLLVLGTVYAGCLISERFPDDPEPPKGEWCSIMCGVQGVKSFDLDDRDCVCNAN